MVASSPSFQGRCVFICECWTVPEVRATSSTSMSDLGCSEHPERSHEPHPPSSSFVAEHAGVKGMTASGWKVPRGVDAGTREGSQPSLTHIHELRSGFLSGAGGGRGHLAYCQDITDIRKQRIVQAMRTGNWSPVDHHSRKIVL